MNHRLAILIPLFGACALGGCTSSGGGTGGSGGAAGIGGFGGFGGLGGFGGGAGSAGIGGGGGAPTANTVPVVVGPGPVPGKTQWDVPYISVTVCLPGTNQCTTVDNVLVDTGSVGLRLLKPALPSGFVGALAPIMASGHPVYQCETFVDGTSWGPLVQLDLQLAGERASNLPTQIIVDPTADSSVAQVPQDCAAAGMAENSLEVFGSNGLIGVGFFLSDCGQPCAQQAIPTTYYSCQSRDQCAGIALPLPAQAQNPIGMFGSDGNGVALTLPQVAGSGAPTAMGTLRFGVSTQDDNQLAMADVEPVDPDGGYMLTVYQGHALYGSFIDSGSNGLYFPSSLPTCSDGSAYYCPPTPSQQSATLQGETAVQHSGQMIIGGTPAGDRIPINFTIDNEQDLQNRFGNDAAVPNLGGQGTSDGFDWGLPFFFGRTVFLVFEGRSSDGGSVQGPAIAF
jgi:hypothetical protein